MRIGTRDVCEEEEKNLKQNRADPRYSGNESSSTTERADRKKYIKPITSIFQLG